jgi:low temperature requirement protein LtrA
MSRFQRHSDGEGQRATSLELFYDLVFVFAVTQVSHLLLTDLTWSGAAQALLILLVVWWAWNYTTWVTNELDPESSIVRLLLLAIMFLSLLMAVAIPDAFGDRALLFAGAYVAIQVGRHTFLTFATADAGTIERRRAGRILTWFVAAGVLWLAGGVAGEEARPWLWLAALAIDYSAPFFLFWVPGRSPLESTSWTVETGHFAERFQLFIIIALGESIVITGATTAGLDLDAARATAFALAFLSSAALWWLYFDYVAPVAERRLELASADRTQLARDGFTYLHVVLVAGVILAAVGDELVIAHPTDMLPGPEIAVVVAGPAVYLLGQVLFRLRLAGSLSWKRLLGALACLAVAALGPFVPALVLGGLTVCVLIAVIGAEQVAGVRRRARGEQSPLERLRSEGASPENARAN